MVVEGYKRHEGAVKVKVDDNVGPTGEPSRVLWSNDRGPGVEVAPNALGERAVTGPLDGLRGV